MAEGSRPSVRRIFALWDGALGPTIEPTLRSQEEAGLVLGVEARPRILERHEDLESTFEAIQRDGFGALSVGGGPMTVPHAGRIADLALRHQLPAIYNFEEFARPGGLMVLSVNTADLYRRAASHVVKILKGAAPGDLPLEQPTKFDLIVNLRTAQALGLTLPQSVLQQATEILE